jgi:hypothetical protein
MNRTCLLPAACCLPAELHKLKQYARPQALRYYLK